MIYIVSGAHHIKDDYCTAFKTSVIVNNILISGLHSPGRSHCTHFSYDMAPVLKPIIVSISYFMMRINATTTKRRNWSENYTIIINLYFIELSLLLQNF